MGRFDGMFFAVCSVICFYLYDACVKNPRMDTGLVPVK